MRRLLRDVLVAGVVVSAAAPAYAGLRFEPVYIYLRPGEPATLVKLTNDGPTPSRFQVGVFAWTQNANGETQLTPTRDVVFFPTVFGLAPGEQRGIRIGTTLPFVAPERTFRILIEELPPERPGAAPAGTVQFQVRSRISLPIFVEPPEPIATARIERVQVAAGKLATTVRSTGTAHLHLQGVQVAALDAANAVVYEKRWGAAYLLAGGELQLSEPLPVERCGAVRAVRIEVQTEKGKLTETVEAGKGACKR
jgi:fimbrial chaperone protein